MEEVVPDPPVIVGVNKFDKVVAPVTLKLDKVVAPADKVEEKVPAAALKLPLKLNEVPVAAPMIGVTSVGLFDKTTLPVPVELVTPVPPCATSIVVPLHVPLEIVPTLVKLELTTLLAKVVPVKVPALAATVISALPSNATPLIFFCSS